MKSRPAAPQRRDMVTTGTPASCRGATENAAFVFMLSTSTHPKQIRFVLNDAGCEIIPVRAPIRTRVRIAGILQLTASIPGDPGLNVPPFVQAAAQVTSDNGCFNNGAFGVGLGALQVLRAYYKRFEE
jgi:hypothetical protein